MFKLATVASKLWMPSFSFLKCNMFKQECIRLFKNTRKRNPLNLKSLIHGFYDLCITDNEILKSIYDWRQPYESDCGGRYYLV